MLNDILKITKQQNQQSLVGLFYALTTVQIPSALHFMSEFGCTVPFTPTKEAWSQAGSQILEMEKIISSSLSTYNYRI